MLGEAERRSTQRPRGEDPDPDPEPDSEPDSDPDPDSDSDSDSGSDHGSNGAPKPGVGSCASRHVSKSSLNHA
jgi:hypothetical protein